MSSRLRGDSARRSRRGAGKVSLYSALVLIAIAALALAYLALGGLHVGNKLTSAPVPDSSPAALASPVPTTTPMPVSTGTAVSLLSSGSTSWWTQSVGAGLVPEVTSGPQLGQAGVNTASLASQIDEAVISAGQMMVVQAGSQDIVDGATGEEIAVGIQGLWQGIRDRGGQPIVVLLLPSNTFPGSVTAVNSLIRTSALDQGVGVLDITSPVSNPDGTWIAGLSDNGQEPNAAGIAILIQAVAAQLPDLVGQSSSNG